MPESITPSSCNSNRLQDLTGQKFGALTAIRMITTTPRTYWECLCDCGNTTTVWAGNLKKGHTQSCGCQKHKRGIQDLTGQKFGLLTVIKLVGRVARHTRWECQCECGRVIQTTTNTLRTSRKRSCGCNVVRGNRRTHGESESPLYGIWSGMIKRCTNPNCKAYKNYGGRGITVCERWKHSFVNFKADVGERPSSDHSIERRDNSKGYSPENCYWATAKQQNRNQRRNRYLTCNDQTLLLI